MKAKISKFYKKGQKIDVQIDKYDTWSMDHTLAHIILPMLIQLKNTKHGIPGDFANVGGEAHDFQSSFDFYKESYDQSFDEGAKRWDEVLDKMIWSFSQILDDDYEKLYFHGEPEFDWTSETSVYSQLVDKNPASHWYDAEGHKLHQERIQEGIDLFAKYYFALWD
jgi:hypothetical protein